MLDLSARSAIRPANPGDGSACAGIVNAWIDQTEWMPRVHSHEEVEAYYRNVVLQIRHVWVIGNPVAGFVALDEEASLITALYVATTGEGLGRLLLNHAKQGRTNLQLWTFVCNHRARRFYAREGFRKIGSSKGENEEGLPDILLEWESPT